MHADRLITEIYSPDRIASLLAVTGQATTLLCDLLVAVGDVFLLQLSS